MSLADYIPTQLEVNRCIKSVAEGAHEAVLLAVHRPAKISYRRVRSQDRVPADEDTLLAHILSSDVASGSLVVPITGASGVGKSHLVRILDARLRSGNTKNRHLIIRIPKSASLREVVKLILAPLPETGYAKVKHAFGSALAEVNVESAAIHMLGHLEVALRRLAVSLRDQAKVGGASQALKERLFHAESLPLLLNDAVTSVHYRTSVLPRIVQRAVAGSGDAPLLGTEGQFSPADIRLPASIDLGQAAKPVSMYYRAGLLAREGQGLLAAAEVLNSVVDEATRQLFRLQDSLGGMTLQEVILEIRRLLLSDGRELILLVEDFAALTGIQETLANVLIQEGIRDGVAAYATMRSVIAVTDGYLVGRDTLATRAAREWIVESELETEHEILELTRSIVVSYLNAARWGEDELIRRYAAASSESERANWLPVFRVDDDDDVSDAIRAFGFENEIPLFPYTAAAIDNLARSALRQGNALLFNPRIIIDEVLRAVLLPARDAFAKTAFPHASVPAREPSADVAQWVASLPGTDAMRARYRRVMVVWGDNPRTRSDLRNLPSPIYTAFGLAPPDSSMIPQVPPAQPVPKPEPGAPRQPKSPASAVIDALEEQRLALERWAQDKVQLPQPIANAIRDEVADQLNDRIDSNAERFSRCTIKPSDISVPEAGGEGRVRDDSIKVSSSNVDPDGTVRGELMAVLRIRAAKGLNDYPEFEDDLARCANLIDRLRPRALTMLRNRNRRQLQLALQAFSANSRLLGLTERGRTAKALAAFLSASPAPPEVVVAGPRQVLADWRGVQQEAAAMRPRLHRFVVNACGCFQGSGDTSNGIDVARIVEAFPDETAAFDYKELDGTTDDERRQLSALTDVRVRARAKGVLQEVTRISEIVHGALGVEFDKNALLGSIKVLAEDVSRMGRWDATSIGASINEFNVLCEEFRTVAVKESLDQVVAARLPDAESSDLFVTRVAQVKFSPLQTAERFLETSKRFIASAAMEVSGMERQVEGIDPAASALTVTDAFDQLQDVLASLASGVPHVTS